MQPAIALPVTGLLVFRAISNKSLTSAGVVVAAITALAHAYHPWNTPFALLCVFFLAGTRVTHIKEDVKKNLTLSSKGSSGGEGPRTHTQVLANSLVASILSILHARQLYARQAAVANMEPHLSDSFICYPWRGDLLFVGIIANYAAVAADTFSSELGILSKGEPRLITSLTLRKVPRGTNGGVSLVGLVAGLFGSMVIVTAAVAFTPMCTETYAKSGVGSWWTTEQKRTAMAFLVIWGALGSVLDSVLGGLFQSSVKDVRSGKIVEGDGGNRVLVTSDCDTTHPSHTEDTSYAEAAAVHHKQERNKAQRKMQATVVDEKDDESTPGRPNTQRHQNWGDEKPSRVAVNGMDLLDNNDVNFIMAVTMSVGAMFVASWYWDIPIQTVMTP